MKKIKLCYIYLNLLVLFTIANNADAQVFTETVLHNINANTGAVVLGMGFSNLSDHGTELCLIPLPEAQTEESHRPAEIQRLNVASGAISFTSHNSFERIADSLGFSIGGQAQFALGSASAEAKFLRESQSTEYSRAMNFEFSLNLPKKVLVNTRSLNEILSPLARSALGRNFQPGRQIPDSFYTLCGDQYVSEINYGAKLFLNAKIVFSNSATRNSFSAAVAASGSWGDFKAELHRMRSTIRNNATISISAYQLGGDPTYLARIFARRGGSADVSAQSAILRCSMDNLESCTQAFEDMLVYANGNEEGDFGPQLRHDHDSGAIVSFQTKSYRYLLGQNAFQNLLTTELNLAREKLGRLFNLVNTIENEARLLMNSADPSRRNHLEVVIETAQQERNYILDAAGVCFQTQTSAERIFNRCKSYVDRIESSISGYMNPVRQR